MKGMSVLTGPQLQQFHAQLLIYRQMAENKPISQNLLFMSDGHMPMGMRPAYNSKFLLKRKQLNVGRKNLYMQYPYMVKLVL